VKSAYGTWRSPLSAPVIAAQGLRLGAVALDGDDVYWLEGRPAEGGRTVLVRRRPDGEILEMVPSAFNVRTRVHEYGGGAYVVAGGTAYFSNFADQRIYRVDTRAGAPSEPVAVTPPGDWFYADAIVDRMRSRLVCVREDHTEPGREPVNTLVSVPLHASPDAGEILTSGHDFYSTPQLSPHGSSLAWLCWNHPQMPWDGTELWIADVTTAGALANPRRIAGSATESIYQPGWSPDGRLYFVSDRDGWWRLYRHVPSSDASGASASSDPVESVLAHPPDDTEFGRPQWIFGTATWAFAGADRIVVSCTTSGRWRLGVIDVQARALSALAPDLEPREWLAADARQAVCVAGAATVADAVVSIDLQSGDARTLRASSTLTLDPGYVSAPLPIEFPTSGQQTAHAFYYPPRNMDCEPPDGERPPVIVISHGGPTTAASATLDLKIQFWTTRGFAVVDVNYGGSSGYGRAYRTRLNGHWGIVDVADTINAARHLVTQGRADPNRLIVRGGSAGGYTTLAALTFHPDAFKAGGCYYGVSDIEVLARDTHKFESRYLDTLVGPYPEMRDEYRARSPIHFVDRLSCPLILFQGLEDKVVPPNQSEMMADAVRAKGWPVAYLTFAGEQHGFRRAETIVRSLEAELFFYGAVFGFMPADAIEPVHIDNLDKAPHGRSAMVDLSVENDPVR
jgi:dipeptidyl aminopeptidase/acylaminoacyl peptidase